MKEATLRVFRGDSNGGQTVDYRVPVAPGSKSAATGANSPYASPAGGPAR